MAPTICSGKKCQSRTIATSDIRRHGRRSQLNQGLSNIVNYVAKGSNNPRVSASMRVHTQSQQEKNTTGTTAHHQPSTINETSSNNYKNNNHNNNHLTQTSATLAANHRRQQFPFVSDNAVTSSTHSDTDNNSFDLRLANDTFSSASSNINPTSSSMSSSTPSLSSSSLKETSSTSSSYHHPQDARRFQRYASKNNGFNDATNATTNKIHSKQHFFHYDHDEEEEVDGVNDDVSADSLYADVSDFDMDTESMTSLDTEKSAELKRGGNHPLRRDKFLAKQQQHNNNRKSLSNVSSSNTEGLLSIAIKTINLVKRNQLLQQRLTQLQLETSDFIQSVLANPENRHFRDNIKQQKNNKEVENV